MMLDYVERADSTPRSLWAGTPEPHAQWKQRVLLDAIALSRPSDVRLSVRAQSSEKPYP